MLVNLHCSFVLFQKGTCLDSNDWHFHTVLLYHMMSMYCTSCTADTCIDEFCRFCMCVFLACSLIRSPSMPLLRVGPTSISSSSGRSSRWTWKRSACLFDVRTRYLSLPLRCAIACMFLALLDTTQYPVMHEFVLRRFQKHTPTLVACSGSPTNIFSY